MLPEVVAEAARRFADHPAFVDPEGRPTTYRQLHRRSRAAATGLARRGVATGDVVALTLDSTVEYVVAYLGAATLGAITAGVNPRLAAAEQARCLEVAGPTLVIESAEEVHDLEAQRDPVSVVPALVPDPDLTVAIVFTSGTTGQPKGAIFANRQLAGVTAIDVGDRWGDGTPLPMLAATQFAHVGFMTKLAWYLRLGATTHLLASWRSGDVLDLLERERIATLGGVSSQVALLLRDPTFDQHDLSAVRSIVMGGGPSSPALVEEARRRFGATYSIRYSSTESGGVGTRTAPDADDHEALHTVGRPWPGVELSIRDGDGQVLPPGDVGQVCLRSPAVMSGYWHDAEASAATLHDGWLHSGDLGRVDDDDCLVLAGRRSDAYVRGGYNVHPTEVESVLDEHPGVADVAVVGVADDVMGEIGVAVVVPVDPTDPPVLDELRRFGAPRLASFKLPERLRLVDQLPLTAMQKLDRRNIRKALLTNVVEDSKPDNPPRT